MTEVNATLFMTHSVRNFTFEGIYDSIMEGAASSTFIELPIPFDKFGWFYPVSFEDSCDSCDQMSFDKLDGFNM